MRLVRSLWCMALGSMIGVSPAIAQTAPKGDIRFQRKSNAPAETAMPAASAEQTYQAEPIPSTPTDEAFLKQVNFDEYNVGDAMADQARMQSPTPMPMHGYAGQSNVNLSTDPANATTGIRLDTAFGVVRDVETAVYLSEHQSSTLTGMTVLPFQTPCWVFGVRGMGGYVDNESMTSDGVAYSIDAFAGTRYKKLYHKIGWFIDSYNDWNKIGLAYSAMTELPILGVTTVDTAFGFRSSNDQFKPGIFQPSTFNTLRIEQAQTDYQFRVGHFWCEQVQTGITGNFYSWEYNDDEWGAGAFANLYLGRLRVSGDVTGGTEGLRGYVKLALSFGANAADRPRDCRVPGVDAVGWVSRATDRDQSVRLRESLTGPIPIAP